MLAVLSEGIPKSHSVIGSILAPMQFCEGPRPKRVPRPAVGESMLQSQKLLGPPLLSYNRKEYFKRSFRIFGGAGNFYIYQIIGGEIKFVRNKSLLMIC